MHFNQIYNNRQSIRLQSYDYSWSGLYFVIMCVKDFECLFGGVKNGKVKLNEYGKIVKSEWLKSAKIRKEIILDEFIIMPNHFHGIVKIIELNEANGIVRANGRLPKPESRSLKQNNFRMKPKLLSIIYFWFKSVGNKKNQYCSSKTKLLCLATKLL